MVYEILHQVPLRQTAVSPHLKGKVERAQRTDLEEFYANVELNDPLLRDRLNEWQHYYNWERVHGAIGMASMNRFLEQNDKTRFGMR